MAVEMFSWPSLHERMCRTWGSNSGPLACQANSLPIELPRPVVTNWKSLFLEILDKRAPTKRHRVKKKCQPEWLTPEILDCMKERKKCKLNGNTDVYKKLRNKVTNLIEIAKRKKKKTYQSKFEEGKSDPRTTWKLFKEFGINCKGNGCENNFGIKCVLNTIKNESDLAELFNNYLVNEASKLKSQS